MFWIVFLRTRMGLFVFTGPKHRESVWSTPQRHCGRRRTTRLNLAASRFTTATRFWSMPRSASLERRGGTFIRFPSQADSMARHVGFRMPSTASMTSGGHICQKMGCCISQATVPGGSGVKTSMPSNGERKGRLAVRIGFHFPSILSMMMNSSFQNRMGERGCPPTVRRARGEYTPIGWPFPRLRSTRVLSVGCQMKWPRMG